MGEVKNISKATLQVVSTDDNLKKASKTIDVLAENGVYDSTVENGDVQKVRNLVNAIYSASTRSVDEIYVIGRSNNLYQI